MTCRQCRGIEQFFDDKVARRQLRHYRRKGPGTATRRLLEAIGAGGVAGRTFIDIGGGIGAIQHDLMYRGAAGGTSADASPAYLAAARTEAESRGYADRMFATSTATSWNARASLKRRTSSPSTGWSAAIPDMPAMVGAAASLARRTVGLIIPRGTRFMRFGVGVANLIQRLRRHPFRIYVHDPDEVEAVLGGHGLSRRYLRDGIIWRVMVFRRGHDRPA